MEYVKRKKVLEALGITYPTLYSMAERKEIETIKVGKNTMYNLDKYIREKKIQKEERRRICYCRVSSNKQKEDLKRQVEEMRRRYPNNEIMRT